MSLLQRIRARFFFALLALLATGGLAAERGAPAAPADLILFNAKVWTVDPSRPVAQAVAVRGTTIALAGTDADVLALKAATQ